MKRLILAATIFLFSISCTKTESIKPTDTSMGKLTFYTNFDAGRIDIYIAGSNVGGIATYFTSGSAKCEQQGACTVQHPDGTYNMRAVSTKGNVWEKLVTFKKGTCDVFLLSK